MSPLWVSEMVCVSIDFPSGEGLDCGFVMDGGTSSQGSRGRAREGHSFNFSQEQGSHDWRRESMRGVEEE